MSEPEEPAAPQGKSAASLREAALTGVRWIALTRLIVEISTLASSVLLAHLISVGEFGAIAPAAFVLAVGGSLAAGSFGTPLIKTKNLTRELEQTALAMSLLTGITVTLLLILALETIDVGYPPHTVHLLQVVAPTFFLYSTGAVSQALIQRDLDFRRSALNDVGAMLPGTVATVVLAFAGLDGLAIAIGFLVMAATSSGQALLWRRPPVPRIHRGSVHEILAFGLPTSASSILYTMQRTIGFAVLGARLDTINSGYYYRATQLGVEYQSKVTNILLKVLFPLLARAETPEQMRAVRSRMVQMHTAFLFPLLALLMVIAPVLVPWLYGEQWSGAIEPTQILAVVGLATVVNTGTGPVVLAAGYPKALLIKDAIELPLLITVLVVGSSYGLIEACAGVAGFRLISLLANQYFLVERLCGIPLRDTLVKDIFPAGTGSLAAAGVGWLVQDALRAAGVPAVPLLMLTVGAGLLTYGVVIKLLFARTWTDCAAVLSRLRPARFSRARPAAT